MTPIPDFADSQFHDPTCDFARPSDLNQSAYDRFNSSEPEDPNEDDYDDLDEDEDPDDPEDDDEDDFDYED